LCQNLEIQIIASNPCFGSTSESFNWQTPNVPDYDIQITNQVSTDFDFTFDWDIPETYEYVKIQVWDEAKTAKLCELNYNKCSNPIDLNSLFHFDIRNCLGNGCLAQCKNYKVVLETKQFCNPTISQKQITWNKSNTTFSMPVNYPNILLANNGQTNGNLCFEPTAADYYHVVVVNRWGNVVFEGEGCVTESPVCVWSPGSNDLTDGDYFYTITFSNQCGQSGEAHNFLTVFAGMIQNNNWQETHQTINSSFNNNAFPNGLLKMNERRVIPIEWEVSLFPNPTNNLINIKSNFEMAEISILDVSGKKVITKVVKQLGVNVDVEFLDAGSYFAEIKSENGLKLIQFVKH
jgi:hypothetical protein